MKGQDGKETYHTGLVNDLYSATQQQEDNKLQNKRKIYMDGKEDV